MVFPPLEPLAVAPVIAGDVVDLGAVAGAGLGVEGEGVGLGPVLAAAAIYHILIRGIALHAGDKQLPHSALGEGHGEGTSVPAIELAHEADLFGVGSPDPEDVAVLAPLPVGMGAEEVLQMGLGSSHKSFQNFRAITLFHTRNLPKRFYSCGTAGEEKTKKRTNFPNAEDPICINYTTKRDKGQGQNG